MKKTDKSIEEVSDNKIKTNGYFYNIYCNEILPTIEKKHNVRNKHCLPKIKKVVVSMGLGLDGSDKKLFDGAMNELSAITGRKPKFTKAKKSISSFKLREGQVVGVFVTLRGKTMYEFLERLVFLALPRIHDFKGFRDSAFDKDFNFSFGIKDHLIFMELSYDKIIKQRGLNITLNIEAQKQEHALDMLLGFNFPIKNKM